MEYSRSCWNGTTSALQSEEITSKVTSFMCVLSINVPIRKKSGNLFNENVVTAFTFSCVFKLCTYSKLNCLK